MHPRLGCTMTDFCHSILEFCDSRVHCVHIESCKGGCFRL